MPRWRKSILQWGMCIWGGLSKVRGPPFDGSNGASGPGRETVAAPGREVANNLERLAGAERAPRPSIHGEAHWAETPSRGRFRAVSYDSNRAP